LRRRRPFIFQNRRVVAVIAAARKPVCVCVTRW
jgi:hypothetical protein